MKIPPTTFFTIFLFQVFINSSHTTTLPIDFVMQSSSCNSNADCPHYRFSKCNTSTNQCESCTDTTDCYHISTASGVECTTTSDPHYCTIPCTSSDNKICVAMRTYCIITSGDTGRCRQCSSDTNCQTQSYPGSAYCDYSTTPGYAVCSSCPSTGSCTGTSTCENFKCVECSGDDECGSGSATPYCEKKFEANYCRACYLDSHCASGHCVSNTCVQCVQDSDCPVTSPVCSLSNSCGPCSNPTTVCSDNFSEKPICSTSGQCIECISHTDCTADASKPECSSTSSTCQACSGSTLCTSLNINLNKCVTIGPNTGKCVQCISSGDCSGTTKVCSETSNTCVECIENTDCTFDSTKTYCSNNLCQAPIYQAQCSRTYTIKVTQQADPNLNKFDLYFPSDLASKIDIKSTLTLILLNVAGSDYISTINKITSTHYQATFTIQATIPATKLHLTLPCPTQPGYIFGHIISDFSTKQIPYTTSAIQETIETIQSLTSTASNVVAGASGSMMLAGSNPAIMWALIGLLQAFYYMIFINVEYPVNVQSFFSLFTLGNLSFIPNPIGWFFPNIDDESLDAPSKFLENDVDGLFLQTAGNMLLTWFLVLVGYITSKFFLRYTRNMPKILNTATAKTVEIFEWSGVLRTLITSYTQICMAAFLQIRVLNFDSKLFGVSSVIGIGFLAFAFLFPPAMIFIIHKFSKSPKVLKAKYSTLTEEFKYNQNNLTPVYFSAFFILRRLVLILTLVFLHNYPLLEVAILILNCMTWLLLLLKYSPYEKKMNNFVNIISEFLFVIIHIIILLFAHDDSNDWISDKQRMNLGWVIIGCCAVILGLTLLVSFIEQYFAAKNLIKLIWKVMKGKSSAPRKIKQKSSPQIYPQNLAQNKNSTLEFSDTSRDQLQISSTSLVLPPPPRRRRIVRPPIRNKIVYNRGSVSP